MASASTASNFATTYDERAISKFGQYRSQVMLGDLPADFLRVQATIYPPQGWTGRHQTAPQFHHQNPSFLGFFTLTIAEVRTTFHRSTKERFNGF